MMRAVFCAILFMGFSVQASAGPISYETKLEFSDGLTDQLDRLNVFNVYERTSRSNYPEDQGFWDGCDAANIFGVNGSCPHSAPSYVEEVGSLGLDSWGLLGINLELNVAGIQGEHLDAHTESSRDGSSSSSISGSFEVGFSDSVVDEILSGDDQGIRLGYGFSWLGFGVLDDFAGISGSWASLERTGPQSLPGGRSIHSSLRTRITASSWYGTGAKQVVLDEVLSSSAERSMVFSPDPEVYGFSEDDIVIFNADFDQRLWVERGVVDVDAPSSAAILAIGLLGLGIRRRYL